MTFYASTLDVARLAAATAGYHCDVEPMEPGRVMVTATAVRDGSTIRCSGNTTAEACSRLISKLHAKIEGNNG